MSSSLQEKKQKLGRPGDRGQGQQGVLGEGRAEHRADPALVGSAVSRELAPEAPVQLPTAWVQNQSIAAPSASSQAGAGPARSVQSQA